LEVRFNLRDAGRTASDAALTSTSEPPPHWSASGRKVGARLERAQIRALLACRTKQPVCGLRCLLLAQQCWAGRLGAGCRRLGRARCATAANFQQ